MKNIMIITTVLFGTVFFSAQKSEIEKHEKVNPVSNEDPHNPLVNGIPYNQYKVQVQAAEKKKAEAEIKAKEAAAARKPSLMKNNQDAIKEQDLKENK